MVTKKVGFNKKITPIGTGWHIVLERAILETIGIEKEELEEGNVWVHVTIKRSDKKEHLKKQFFKLGDELSGGKLQEVKFVHKKDKEQEDEQENKQEESK